MKNQVFIFIVFVFLSIVANAQRTYFETDISKEIFKNFEISLSPQVRFKEGFELKQYFFDAGVEYKLNKYFSVGTSYRLGTNITKNDNKEYFGRFAFDAKTKVKWKNFEPKFRLRYTNLNEDFASNDSDKYSYLRYKFELEYKIKKLDLNPYIYAELFQNLSESSLNGTRYEGGLMYKISKHHYIGAYYRMNYKSGNNEHLNVFGLTYKLKL
jgi:hypothetical protein